MKKKFLALVMTLSMVLSLVPMTALAAEGGTAPATQEGQSVGADATGNSSEGDTGSSDTPNENENPNPSGNDAGTSDTPNKNENPNPSGNDTGTSDTPNENENPNPSGKDTGDSENSDGDASQDWKVDKENKTIEIYNATGLRAWANSISQTDRNTEKDPNYGDTIYDGYTMKIINDIDLSGDNWTSVLRLGGTFSIDGNGKTISNMNINKEENSSIDGKTYLGFIGDLAYKARLTVKNLTFENAHVQDREGDKQYSWCGVVVGHGPMDCVSDANVECTFENVNVENSVVTGGHSNAAIIGYASSTNTGFVFKNCSVKNTFIGGYNSTSAILFGSGFANIEVENCSAEGVRLYSDGLTFGSTQSYTNEQYTYENLWAGVIYHNYTKNSENKKVIVSNNRAIYTANTAESCYIVYPVLYKYDDGVEKQAYAQVNGTLPSNWYKDSELKNEVTSITANMYPYGKQASRAGFESDIENANECAYDTQAENTVNPLTHSAIILYSPDNGKPISPEPEPTPVDWDFSKSKTATQLVKSGSTYTSDVTLSLPSKEEVLSTDIVFVLDTSDCVGDVMGEISSLTEKLNEAGKTGANIKVGVIVFKGSALPMFDGNLVSVAEAVDQLNKMAREVAAIPGNDKNAKEQVVLRYLKADDNFIAKGSNLHAGLMAAQKMLTADDSVEASRKYLVSVSDGKTYYWNDEEDNVYGVYSEYKSDNEIRLPSLLFYAWTTAYGIDDGSWALNARIREDNWNTYIATIRQKIQADNGKYTVNLRDAKTKLGTANYDALRWSTGEALTGAGYQYIKSENVRKSAQGVEYSFVKCLDTYKELVGSGYHCYMINPKCGTDTVAGLFTSKLNEIAGVEKDVNFSEVKNEILYAISAGSTVEDVMGEEFDFAGNVRMTVGGKPLKAIKDGDNIYYFGNEDVSATTYRFKLEYTPGTDSFVWTINENVSNFAFVQLTYTVRLVNPKTASGTYGVIDLDGDMLVDDSQTTVNPGDALYTNERAVLTPIGSDNQKRPSEEFQKPSVSYTVSGGGGGGGGGTITIPDDVPTGLDLKNHYGYIIGYPVDYYTGKPTTDQTKKPVRPEGKITRAEVATIYFRMLTDENRAANWNQVSGFSDVKSSAWYNNAISTLTKAGILKGYEDGTFQPNGYITRAEFATIAIRFFSGVYEGEDLFPDIKGHWAEDYINNAANKGLVKGYEDGTFGPDRYITRAEAVTLVNRTLNRHPHNDGLHQDMLRWPDNMDTSKWYYADMQEATNSHEPDKDKTTADKEYWGKMLPIRDWEALEKEWSNANSAPGEGEVV